MKLKIGLVTEPLASKPLREVMDWVISEVPEISALEIGAGAYAPTSHCDMPRLLKEAAARRAWKREIDARGLEIAAFNCWGNPLHPDESIARAHDAALRDTIRLASELGVDRIVALAGCPAGFAGDVTPHFAGGGWLPYLESVHQRQWKDQVHDYWAEIGDFDNAIKYETQALNLKGINATTRKAMQERFAKELWPLMVRGDNAAVHDFYASLGYYDQKRVTFAKWLDGRAPTP